MMKKAKIAFVVALLGAGQVQAVTYDSMCQSSSTTIGMKPSALTTDFEIPADVAAHTYSSGVVIDKRTNLMWMRCEVGRAFTSLSGSCSGTIQAMNWQGALQQVIDFNAGTAVTTNFGHSDWRIPNVKELMSIVEHQCVSPALNDTVFPNAENKKLWTNTPAGSSTQTLKVRVVDFNSGTVTTQEQTNNVIYLRLVRDVTP